VSARRSVGPSRPGKIGGVGCWRAWEEEVRGAELFGKCDRGVRWEIGGEGDGEGGGGGAVPVRIRRFSERLPWEYMVWVGAHVYVTLMFSREGDCAAGMVTLSVTQRALLNSEGSGIVLLVPFEFRFEVEGIGPKSPYSGTSPVGIRVTLSHPVDIVSAIGALMAMCVMGVPRVLKVDTIFSKKASRWEALSVAKKVCMGFVTSEYSGVGNSLGGKGASVKVPSGRSRRGG
jgi:hypothetical protein